MLAWWLFGDRLRFQVFKLFWDGLDGGFWNRESQSIYMQMTPGLESCTILAIQNEILRKHSLFKNYLTNQLGSLKIQFGPPGQRETPRQTSAKPSSGPPGPPQGAIHEWSVHDLCSLAWHFYMFPSQSCLNMIKYKEKKQHLFKSPWYYAFLHPFKSFYSVRYSC